MRRTATFALALAALVSMASAGASQAPAGGLEAVQGRFAHAGGAADRRGIEAAIDRATEPMEFFVRPMARSRLRDRLAAAPSIVVERLAEGRVRITFGEWSTPPLALRGRAVAARGSEGDAVQLTLRERPEGLYLRAQAEQGARESWLSRDGADGLSLQVRVTAERLPAPIEYRLRYRRQG